MAPTDRDAPVVNEVPTQRLLATPTPPATTTLPVMEEVASVVDDVDKVLAVIAVNVDSPEAVNVVAETEANVLAPATTRFNPTLTLFEIPIPPVVVIDPVVVDDDSVVVVIEVVPEIVRDFSEVAPFTVNAFTHRLFAIPTPPATVILPVVVDVESVVPFTLILVAVVVDNTLVPETVNIDPM